MSSAALAIRLYGLDQLANGRLQYSRNIFILASNIILFILFLVNFLGIWGKRNPIAGLAQALLSRSFAASSWAAMCKQTFIQAIPATYTTMKKRGNDDEKDFDSFPFGP